MNTITKEQLKKKMDSVNDITVVNTLPEDQFENNKIDGSINIPQTAPDFVDRVSAAVSQNKNAEIVVYCASAKCDSSTQAAKKLEQAGFTKVFEYEGGAQEWNQMHEATAKR